MSDKTSSKAIFLIILCTLFTSIGQLLWKKGLINLNFSDWLSFLNWFIILGFISYGFGFILMLLALKSGELSVLYPIIATSFIWISIFSPIFFPSDVMNIWKWAGVILIIISVSLLGIGAKRNNQEGAGRSKEAVNIEEMSKGEING